MFRNLELNFWKNIRRIRKNKISVSGFVRRWSIYNIPNPTSTIRIWRHSNALDDENVPRPQQLPISEQWTGNVRETTVVMMTFMHGDTLYTGSGTFRIRATKQKKSKNIEKKENKNTIVHNIRENIIIQ